MILLGWGRCFCLYQCFDTGGGKPGEWSNAGSHGNWPIKCRRRKERGYFDTAAAVAECIDAVTEE